MKKARESFESGAHEVVLESFRDYLFVREQSRGESVLRF